MYKLSCCSTVDLPKNEIESRGICYIPMPYEIDGQLYKDDLGESMSYDEFYTRIDNGALPTTSQINPDQYIKHFKKILDKGMDVLHVTLSSGLSGMYQNAVLAANMLADDYPDRKIYVVDSLGASSGSGLLMLMASDMQLQGADIDTVHEWLENNKLRMNHLFCTENLSHLHRGGRLSAAGALIGSMLNICPTMFVNEKGELKVDQKIRGRKKALRQLCNTMEDTADDGLNYSGYLIISHSHRKDLADELYAMVTEKFKNIKEIKICDIGCTIGSHVGSGTACLFYVGKPRG